ncbi:MAG: hypothetical protein O2984_01585 [Bacteroidetes bacterium]|nr:hypothetical protein [Bacteroidota bacterium]
MRQLSVLFSLVMLIGLISCQPKQDRSADIQTLKSYLSKVDSVEQVFLSIDQAKYNTILGETKVNLDRFKMGYKGELVKEQARVLSEYNNVKRLIKDFPRQCKRIESEIERTKTQLTGLIEVMESGADVDGSGRDITEEYLNKQMSVETKVAESLIEEISKLDGRLVRTSKQYEAAKAPMLNMMSELIPNNK